MGALKHEHERDHYRVDNLVIFKPQRQNSDAWLLEVGDLVLLKTSFNRKLGKIGFAPSFPSSDAIFDSMESSIRVFRPLNNNFSLGEKGEEWLVRVETVKVNKWKRTSDDRIFVYIGVKVSERVEVTVRHYYVSENLYTETIQSGTSIISSRIVRNPKVEEKYYLDGTLVSKGMTIFSPEGERLAVNRIESESKEGYFQRRVAEIKDSPFAGKLGQPADVIGRELKSFPKFPSEEKFGFNLHY